MPAQEITVEYLQNINLEDLERTGYTFVGWYVTQSCDNGDEFNEITMPSHDIYLYAKWNINPYKLKFVVLFFTNNDEGRRFDSLLKEYKMQIL